MAQQCNDEVFAPTSKARDATLCRKDVQPWHLLLSSGRGGANVARRVATQQPSHLQPNRFNHGSVTHHNNTPTALHNDNSAYIFFVPPVHAHPPNHFGAFVWPDGVDGSSVYGYDDTRGALGCVCVVATDDTSLLCARDLEASCDGCGRTPSSSGDSSVHAWFYLVSLSTSSVHLSPRLSDSPIFHQTWRENRYLSVCD